VESRITAANEVAAKKIAEKKVADEKAANEALAKKTLEKKAADELAAKNAASEKLAKTKLNLKNIGLDTYETKFDLTSITADSLNKVNLSTGCKGLFTKLLSNSLFGNYKITDNDLINFSTKCGTQGHEDSWGGLVTTYTDRKINSIEAKDGKIHVENDPYAYTGR
jgi:hypothetical protein